LCDAYYDVSSLLVFVFCLHCEPCCQFSPHIYYIILYYTILNLYYIVDYPTTVHSIVLVSIITTMILTLLLKEHIVSVGVVTE
jgi:hypothetical protein